MERIISTTNYISEVPLCIILTASAISLTHELRVCLGNAALPDWIRDNCTTRYRESVLYSYGPDSLLFIIHN